MRGVVKLNWQWFIITKVSIKLGDILGHDHLLASTFDSTGSWRSMYNMH